MRRLLPIALVLLSAAGLLFARSGMQSPAAQPEGEKKIIDLKSDLSGPIAPGDSVIFLVGNFAAQHNGAVITCDSAVRYSDKHIEFFGNVLINKNTTYIYGDRADYNGELNEARVYSDLIKVVDEDATLYTYQFVFNTKENIGRFDGGGVMVNRDNILESARGFYYADAKELICVERVEMRNEEYELKGDSVVYNMATDHAFFFERTNIWSKDGDYLYADRGSYNKADSLYIVTRNGYVLTEKQEMWSDSIDYYRGKEHVILKNKIQIDDAEHKVLAFGNYGEYWKTPGDAFLTRDPAIVSYDLSQGDSLFMRSDSMLLYTLRLGEPIPGVVRVDSVALVGGDSTVLAGAPGGALQRDSLTNTPAGAASDAPSQTGSGQTPEAASQTGTTDAPPAEGKSSGETANGGGDSGTPSEETPASGQADSLRGQRSDSLARVAADSIPTKAQLKEAARKAREEKKLEEAKARKERLDTIAAQRRIKINARLTAEKEREEARLKAMKVKAESKLRARQARAERKGKPIPSGSPELKRIDSLLGINAGEQDSLARMQGDSLVVDSLARDSLGLNPPDSVDSLAPPVDSIYRLIKGFRNVRMYRTDFQSVCDSLTAISTDSTIHLYIEPVLWNENNQITSEVMDIFTKNQQVVRAEFIGSPMMVSELDTMHYNQIAGKEMTAYFRNSEIYRNDVNGNAQTLYYSQDGEPPQITGLFVIESGGIKFYIEDKQVVRMVWTGNPVYNIYPIDKIPETVEQHLKGFKWEGARRPTQKDVFDRPVRPSEREERSSLRHPDFPIMHSIDEHKKRLLELRRWADRNDKVDAGTVEWMRELGYQVGQPRESGAKF